MITVTLAHAPSVNDIITYDSVFMQQLANMTMEGNRERRYFTAVAGDKNQKGELFGWNNLLPLRKPGQPGLNLTLDILKVTREPKLPWFTKFESTHANKIELMSII